MTRSITGTISFATGDSTEISDEIIIQNSLSISMSTSLGGKFSIGTFNSAVLKIGIIDPDAVSKSYDNAVISLTETITEGENVTTTPLGVYKVEGEKTKRRRGVVSLTAYDKALDFDISIDNTKRSEIKAVSAWLEEAFTAAAVAPSSDYADIMSDLPNAELNVGIGDVQIQTWRDVVIMCCQAMCCNAVINRDGQFELRRAKYKQSGNTAIVDHDLTEKDRISISFSDARTYIRYLTAYSAKGTRKSYITPYTPPSEETPAAREGEYTMQYNPMLSDSQADAANENISGYIGFIQREIKCRIFGRSQIKLGDTIGCTGGAIDLGRRLMGVVTDIEYKYNGATTITCRAPSAR